MSNVESIIYGNSDKRIWLFKNDILVETDATKPKGKYLNVSDNFTVTIDHTLRTYDLDLAFPGYAIPQEGGVNQGTVQRPLNFNDTHFDIAEVVATPGSYDITNTAYGQVFVNALTTPHKLNISGNGVAITEDNPNDEADIVITDEKVKVYLNDVLVNALAAHLNFSTDFSATYDATTLRHDVSALCIPATYRKRWGSIQWSDAPDVGCEGLLNGITEISDGDSNDISPFLDANGGFRRLMTGGSDNDTLGWGTTDPISRLAFSPHFWCMFKIPTVNSFRVFMGYHNLDVPDSDNTFLDDNAGFALTCQKDTVPDVNWMIRRSDGAGVATEVSTAVATTANAIVTFELIGEPTPTPRWGWRINGGAFTYYAAAAAGDTPALDVDLRFMIRLEQQGGTEQELDLYYAYIEQNM